MDRQPGLAEQSTTGQPVFETGCEYVVDAYECDSLALRDLPALRGLCNEIVAHLGLKVVGEPHWHQFPDPGGVTGLYLLSESHLACHTYPEFGFASFNLYCCRRNTDWPWETALAKTIGSRRVVVRSLPRGQHNDEVSA
ncbi:MAG: S-adenosylmethionine decarboxylase family protein [Planctomycetaceae bacterium]